MTLAFERVFTGEQFLENVQITLEQGRISGIAPAAEGVPLHKGLLCAGMVDLQVNGGAGVMLSGQVTAAEIAEICTAHARQGATTILPTLITDTAEATAHFLAQARKVEGLAGVHLEGPHLDPHRHGAHDPAKIRPMTEADLALYCEAARHMFLKITLAPASATPDQVARLARAGVLVALGHAACSYEEAHALYQAGTRAVTHLFNAMSQLGHRAPGLVGAALDLPLHAGLIADGHHVAPAAAKVALAASDRIYLVSDAMAVSGSNLARFSLQGREIYRSNGRLTLGDGTLAGADLTMPQAVANLVSWGIDPRRALKMATVIPADLIGRADLGRIALGASADLLHLDADFQPRAVWKAGVRLC